MNDQHQGESSSIAPVDVRLLLLQILPKKRGMPQTEEFKCKLKSDAEKLQIDFSSTIDARVVAESLLRQLRLAGLVEPSPRSKSGGNQPNAASVDRQGLEEKSHLGSMARVSTESGQYSDSYLGEHPAVIANRLIRLPLDLQNKEIFRMSGGLARQVKFIMNEVRPHSCRSNGSSVGVG